MQLPDIRNKIDQIDTQLMDLLSERASLVHKVGEVKKSEGLPIFAPERESAVYERLCQLNNGRLPHESVIAIFREIMSTALKLENDLCIAFLGPEGSWTHQAALNKFGHSVRYLAAPNFKEVFEAVHRGKADYGVIPVENSTEGTVTTTLDLLMDYPLQICSQMFTRIDECLLSHSSQDEIHTIYSHHQGFAQCRGWLNKHLPKAQLVESPSTAKGAEIAAAKTEPGYAAIASALSGQIFDIPVLEHAIQDLHDNTTRFFVIGQKMCPPTGNDRTSLFFSVKHEPGSLLKALQCLECHHINLTSIQSRPCKHKAWEYVFFTDLEGHCESDNMKAALADLDKVCQNIKVLGSYPMPEFTQSK